MCSICCGGELLDAASSSSLRVVFFWEAMADSGFVNACATFLSLDLEDSVANAGISSEINPFSACHYGRSDTDPLGNLGDSSCFSTSCKWITEGARVHHQSWSQKIRQLHPYPFSTTRLVNFRMMTGIVVCLGSIFRNPVSASTILIILSAITLQLSPSWARAHSFQVQCSYQS